jgi:hypothetical protein
MFHFISLHFIPFYSIPLRSVLLCTTNPNIAYPSCFKCGIRASSTYVGAGESSRAGLQMRRFSLTWRRDVVKIFGELKFYVEWNSWGWVTNKFENLQNQCFKMVGEDVVSNLSCIVNRNSLYWLNPMRFSRIVQYNIV